MNNTRTRIETLARTVRRPRVEAQELREHTVETVSVIVGGLLEDLGADVVEVSVLNGVMTRLDVETVETFRARVLDAVTADLDRQPLPLTTLASFYRLLPLSAT